MLAGAFKVKILLLVGKGRRKKLVRARTPCAGATNLIALHVEAQWAVPARIRRNNFIKAE
jgi:hypothetical protein